MFDALLAKEPAGVDGIFFNALAYIEHLHGFYMGKVMIVGGICFAMSLGIGAVKMALGGEELNKFFAKYLIMIITFFIMIGFLPKLLLSINGVVNSVAYSAVSSNPRYKDEHYFIEGKSYEIEFRGWLANMGTKWVKGDVTKEMKEAAWSSRWDFATENETKKELLNNTVYIGLGGFVTNRVVYEQELTKQRGEKPVGNIWDNKVWAPDTKKGEQSLAYDNFLKMKVTYHEFGIISIDKLFQSFFVLSKVCIEHLKKLVEGIGFFTHIVEVALIIGVFFAVFNGTVAAVMEYVICMVYFVFLYGIGVIFIPFLLWEGTDHAFKKLIRSIFNITIRILITSICIYLMLLVQREVIWNMFVLEKIIGADASMVSSLEYYLMIIFGQFLVMYLLKNANGIAQFLTGAGMNANYKNALAAGKATAGSFAAGAGIAAGVAKLAIGAGANLMAGGVAGLAGAGSAASKARQMEGDPSKKGAAGLSAFASSLGRSGFNTMKGLGGNMLGGIGKIGAGALKNGIGVGGGGGGKLSNPLSGGMYGTMGNRKDRKGNNRSAEDRLGSNNVFDRMGGAMQSMGDRRKSGQSLGQAIGGGFKDGHSAQVNQGGGAGMSQNAQNDAYADRDKQAAGKDPAKD